MGSRNGVWVDEEGGFASQKTIPGVLYSRTPHRYSSQAIDYQPSVIEEEYETMTMGALEYRRRRIQNSDCWSLLALSEETDEA